MMHLRWQMYGWVPRTGLPVSKPILHNIASLWVQLLPFSTCFAQDSVRFNFHTAWIILEELYPLGFGFLFATRFATRRH